MVSAIEQLNAALATENTALTDLTAELTKLESDYADIAAAASTPPDVSAAILAANANLSIINAALASIQAADPATVPPASPPAA